MVSFFLNVHPYLGKWSNLTSICFKWVGSTTNWPCSLKMNDSCTTWCSWCSIFFAFTSQDSPALVWGSRSWTRRANSYSSISTYSHVGMLEIKWAMLLTCPIALNQSLLHGRNRSQFQAILCLDVWHVCESEGVLFFLPNLYSNVTNVYKVVVV